MKTDRELLELAARAAGISLSNLEICIGDEVIGYQWTPLTDDGDALRLAVKLKLDVCFYDGYEELHAGGDGIESASIEAYSEDMHKSTRRAIVRAAAAIGESM